MKKTFLALTILTCISNSVIANSAAPQGIIGDAVGEVVINGTGFELARTSGIPGFDKFYKENATPEERAEGAVKFAEAAAKDPSLMDKANDITSKVDGGGNTWGAGDHLVSDLKGALSNTPNNEHQTAMKKIIDARTTPEDRQQARDVLKEHTPDSRTENIAERADRNAGIIGDRIDKREEDIDNGIKSNQDQIAKNKAENDSKNASQDTKIDANRGNIDANKDQIAKNKTENDSKNASQDTKIDANKDNIDANRGNIDANRGNIDANKDQIAKNKTENDSKNASQDTKIDANKGNIDANKDQIAKNKTENDSKNASQDTKIDANKDQIAKNKTENDSKNASQDTKIDANKDQIVKNKTENDEKNASQDTKIDANKGNIDANKDQIAENKTANDSKNASQDTKIADNDKRIREDAEKEIAQKDAAVRADAGAAIEEQDKMNVAQERLNSDQRDFNTRAGGLINSNTSQIETNTGNIDKNSKRIDSLEQAFEKRGLEIQEALHGVKATTHATINARPFALDGEFAMGLGLGASGNKQALSIGGAYGIGNGWSTSFTATGETAGDYTKEQFSAGAGLQKRF